MKYNKDIENLMRYFEINDNALIGGNPESPEWHK